MPVELYETLFLLDSNKLSADADAVKGQLHGTIEKHGGRVEVERPWDDRKLAYPIKKQKKGAYYIVYYRMDSLKQHDMDRDLKLNEAVLRYMTIHVDPKWSEAVMDVARNDHATAFALRGMQEEMAPTDVNPTLSENLPEGEAVAAATGGRRPRREPVGEKPE
ncbi:MAG TPA: 30S ribosomal protein S6 [Fimbriiglobus sp.]|nr:30S ribosomal protein S6 [Fimbriiglobus sp.]